jgi:hypothetical protein
MLEFLIDNIFVSFGGTLFQQVVDMPMGTNCALLLADLFLYSYESEFLTQTPTVCTTLCNLQSTYRALHSTETALLCVHHDIVPELDRNCCVVLLMLDLSAAFDVVNHSTTGRRHANGYELCPSSSRFIFILI